MLLVFKLFALFESATAWNPDGDSRHCQEGYFLDTYGQCRELIDHCTEYNAIGGCVACEAGYFARILRTTQISSNAKQRGRTNKGKADSNKVITTRGKTGNHKNRGQT